MNLREWVSAEKGRAAALARALVVNQQLVGQWAKEEGTPGWRRIPLDRCVDIERATGGAVTCEEQRPDQADYFAYLRGRADPNQSSATATPEEAARA